MKKCVSVVLVLIILISLVLILNRFNVIHFNKPIEEFLVFNTDDIVQSEDLVINELVNIDDKNFLLVYRVINASANNEINDSPVSIMIYKYNLDTGLNKNGIRIDNGCSCIGLDNSKNMAYFIGTDFYNPEFKDKEIYPTYLYNINYNTMNLEKTSEDVGNKYNVKISPDNKYWTYNTDEGLYVSEPCFENPRVLFSTITKKDIMDIESNHPNEFVNNKIIYSTCGYEWIKGIGIVNMDGTNNKFIPISDGGYVLYDDDTSSIYYADSYINMPLMKVNIDTLEQIEVFNIVKSENDKLHYVTYLSPDLKYVALVVEDYSNAEKNKVYVDVYDLITKEKINTYEVMENEYNYVTSIEFIDDSIVMVESANSVKLWNFKK